MVAQCRKGAGAKPMERNLHLLQLDSSPSRARGEGLTALLWKRMFGAFALAIAFSLAGAVGARAERPIGVASAVRPVVEQVGAPTQDEVKTGDAIFMNEAIKTGPMAAATITFTDNARLTINSASRTVLSSFVFADAKRFFSAIFHLAKGSFSFAPGDSETRAYVFKTPTAVLTLRDAAAFDVTVTEQKTIVRVVSGTVELCGRGDEAALLLSKDAADDLRESNVITFSKAPPSVPKDCLLIGPGETWDPTDVAITQVEPLIITKIPPYAPPPPPVSPH
jgi:FecR protein